MMRLRRLALAALALLVAGCTTGSLEELRSATPKGTPFQAALAVRYLRISRDDERNSDWENSDYFADKGLQAAYGHDVSPEEPEQWNLADERIAQARARLMSLLTPEHIRAAPDTAADAQGNFDCWVQNAADEAHPDDLADCKYGFEQAAKSLEHMAPAPSVSEAPPEAYIIFFGFDSDRLNLAAERMVDGVADALFKKHEPYRVMVNGHADKVGSARYNFALSLRRARTVLSALVERGIPKALIRAFGFGDTDPRVPEKRGVPEPRNRRVEIYIG